MIAATWYDPFLDGLGAVLAFLYDLVPNYGVAIILFTLAIRLLMLPLGIKQVRSMHAMQAIQPKVKQIQQKYKGNRQKISEETMTLYREHGVNPLSGCLPILVQFPVLIALFAVLQFPQGLTRIPDDSDLHGAIRRQETTFAGANLLCNAGQAGRRVRLDTRRVPEAPDVLDCGSGFPVRIPYYALALAMIGTTFYQQRQMQKSTPSGNPQQQMLTRILPILFGVWGFIFPAGLVVYWTTTNLVQIGQQHFLLRQGRTEPPPPDGKRAASASKAKATGRPGTGSKKPARGAVAEGEAQSDGGKGQAREDGSKGGSSASSRRSGTARKTGQSGQSGRTARPRPASGSSGRTSGGGSKSGGTGSAGSSRPSGGSDGADRKKRRKR